ncbi:MAG: alpha/beta fold hydrolase [Bacteroidetes bacterium]|nr:MAG: alpha/beta fold hydrolase [Bacteroidota bacterium]
MKNLLSFFCLILLPGVLPAQDISGDWHGLLEIQGLKLRLVFHLTQDGDTLHATLDSPDQGAFGMPVREATFGGNQLSIQMPDLFLQYTGTPNADFTEMTGTFRQGAVQAPLSLSRKAPEKPVVRRPQTPEKPYPYREEEVRFSNPRAQIQLAGTLTIPQGEGPFPVVVLISGSGPQDRNESLMGHQPFLIIADYLTRKGIAVLRFDDRGVGASEGDFSTATSADFATDVLAAVHYLKSRKDIRADQIGLAGHSEGGLIAPIVAAKSPDVRFIVLLAAPGVKSRDLMLKQLELISRAQGESEEGIKEDLRVMGQAYDMVVQSTDPEKLKTELEAFFDLEWRKLSEADRQRMGGDKDTFLKQTIRTLTSPWFIYFLKFDPAEYLSHVKCPVLAVNGAKDLQVDAQQNLSGIRNALLAGKNAHFTVKEFPELNHLFQHCDTGAPTEYAQIEETFSEEVLQYISDWILDTLRE